MPRPATVIHHGIDIDLYSPPADRRAAFAETGLPGKYGIGIFGRVRRQKGADLFIEAMCRLLPQYPDFSAVVIGLATVDNRPFLEGLKQRVAAAGLGERIRFLGELPIEEVPRWYQRISIYVFASRVEGFGLTMLEAMAAGDAVVATRAGAAEMIISDGDDGVLAPVGDVDALVAALEPLMRDPERIEAMGRRARARVVSQFSRDREADEISAVYRQVWAASKALPRVGTRLTASVQAALGRTAANRRLNGADTWCRNIANRRSPSEVTQLNWMTRRSPANGLWPCQELSARLNARSVPSVGGASMIMSSRSSADFNRRRRPPGCSQAGVHVNQDRYDLAFRVGMDAPVLGAALTANRDRGRPPGEIEAELFLERFAELVALQFVEEFAERGSIGKLRDGKASALGDFRIVGVDFRARLGRTKPGTTKYSKGSFVSGTAFKASRSRWRRGHLTGSDDG